MTDRVTKRWRLSTNGGASFDHLVEPLNSASIKFSWSRDLNAGQIFFRLRMTSPLIFDGDTFHLIYNMVRTPVRRCETVYIRQDRLCNGQWKKFWVGRFSPGSCKYVMDLCQVEVKADVFDKYTCLLDHVDDKVNLMDVAPADVLAYNYPSNIEYLVCLDGVVDPECDPASLGDNGWVSVAADTACSGASNITMYWREKLVTNCVAGVAVPPTGAGWMLLSDNCLVDGTAVYVRNPPVAWGFGAPTKVEDGSPSPTEPVGGCSSWVYMGTVLCDPFGPTYAHFWTCPYDASPEEYSTGRPFNTTVSYMLERTGCDVDRIVSDFFDINPKGDSPGYVSGENYITGGPNFWSDMVLLQKSDAKDPTATNPATRGEWTLKKLFDFLRSTFRVYWDIDDMGNLRLEHWHFWSSSAGIDLTDPPNGELNLAMNTFQFLSDEIPKYERLTFSEANGSDFSGLDIIYDGPCVTTDQKNLVEETRISDVTTDIGFILSDPTAIGNDGFALLACTENTGVYTVIIDDGAISLSPVTNAPVSKANLQAYFWTWDRYLKTGNMNGVDVTFDGIVPNLQQPDLKARFCCGMEDWEPRDTITTELGIKYLNARPAYVEKAELEDFDDRLTITPRYAY